MGLQAPNNRRQFGRRTVYWHAWIVMNDRRRLPCIVHNVSEGGAYLEFPGQMPNTDTFRLLVEEQGIDQLCDVRHRSDESRHHPFG